MSAGAVTAPGEAVWCLAAREHLQLMGALQNGPVVRQQISPP